MRDLLRGFADDGGTVLLSSHLLAEIDAIADDIVIMGAGRVQASGTKAELAAERPLEDVFFDATAGSAREGAAS